MNRRLLRAALFLLAVLMLMFIIGFLFYINEQLSQNVKIIVKNDNDKNEITIQSLNNRTIIDCKELPKGFCNIPVSLRNDLTSGEYKVYFYNNAHLYDSAFIHKNYIMGAETVVIDVRSKGLKIDYIRRF